MVGILLLQIVDGSLESQDAIHSVCLVESEVRLVGHAIRCCGVDDQGIELAEGAENVVLAVFLLCLVNDTLGYLVDICIQSYTEKTLLLLNLLY